MVHTSIYRQLYVVLHSLLSEIDGIVSAMLGDPLMRFVPKLLLLAPLYMYTPVQSELLKGKFISSIFDKCSMLLQTIWP